MKQARKTEPALLKVLLAVSCACHSNSNCSLHRVLSLTLRTACHIQLCSRVRAAATPPDPCKPSFPPCSAPEQPDCMRAQYDRAVWVPQQVGLPTVWKRTKCPLWFHFDHVTNGPLKKARLLAVFTFQFCLVLHHASQVMGSVMGGSSSKLAGSRFFHRVSHG